MNIAPSPLPLFDSIEYIKDQKPPTYLKHLAKKDYLITKKFLVAYSGRSGTFNSYRREVERLLHWCNNIANKSLKQLKACDIEDFISFCQAPPASWIGTSIPARFYIEKAVRVPNSEWRPFVATLPKTQTKKGNKAKIEDYELSQGAIKELLQYLVAFITIFYKKNILK